MPELVGLMLVVSGFALGWVVAHRVILAECENSGKLYIGHEIYTVTKDNVDT